MLWLEPQTGTTCHSRFKYTEDTDSTYIFVEGFLHNK